MKTSIIVSCHHKHFYLIPELLSYYERQSVIPDEVVISLTLSQTDKIADGAVEAVKNKEWPFKVLIVTDEGEFPGLNRNRACEFSSGDLLICQDADDIPHPRRIEIIKHLFENYKVDLLIHRWRPTGHQFQPYHSKKSVKACSYFSRYSEISSNYDYIHNGNIALRREVYNTVKWPPYRIGEDIWFNERVFENFKYKVGLNQYLIIYRYELSSYKDRD